MESAPVYRVVWHASFHTYCESFLLQISGEEAVFSHVIMELTPETTYEVQVCQAELDTCGNCLVDFTTLAAEGVYNYSEYVHVQSYEGEGCGLRLLNWLSSNLEPGGLLFKFSSPVYSYFLFFVFQALILWICIGLNPIYCTFSRHCVL